MGWLKSLERGGVSLTLIEIVNESGGAVRNIVRRRYLQEGRGRGSGIEPLQGLALGISGTRQGEFPWLLLSS